MTRTIKARELGDEHTGARIQTTMLGWTIEGELAELAEVLEGAGDYYYLRAKGAFVTMTVRKDADVTILKEAPIWHPDEPTGLGAVVEADVGGGTPVRWVSVVDFQGAVRWLRPETGLGTWYTWSGVQGDTIAPIRVLSEGVRLSDDETETPEVYEGMAITEWPEDDKHLQGWVLEDPDGDEWLWEIREGDVPGQHWRFAGRGYPEPFGSPWKVVKKADV